MDFATALKTNLEADPKLSRRGQRILDVINARPSKRRTRRLERMEAHARAQLGFTSGAKVDWATAIDWPTLLKTILDLLLKLLPLILAL